MRKLLPGLICAAFFITGDLFYGLLTFQHEAANPSVFFGAVVAAGPWMFSVGPDYKFYIGNSACRIK